MVIFDCNGVLVDSEPLATAIVSQEFVRAGFPLTPDMIARYFTGRRPADMFADVECTTGRKLPTGFAPSVADSILRVFAASCARLIMPPMRCRGCADRNASPRHRRLSEFASASKAPG